MNWKKTICMVIKKVTVQESICRHRKQVWKVYYLGSVLKKEGKCQTEIRRHTGKDAFQILSKILRNGNILFEIKKRVLNSYVILVFFYGCECR